MLGEPIYPLGKQRYLNLYRAGIFLMHFVCLDNSALFFLLHQSPSPV
jgi:hypothetical protein